ncbi:DUF222 domain-containing protein [Actinopolymorpha sp. B17G11]|uniref:HNH endonuclease signature motif containing protein n=1 Tax=unclassified Actinopolymorpha TaxID=2627063 RepID=UPI0032D90C61
MDTAATRRGNASGGASGDGDAGSATVTGGTGVGLGRWQAPEPRHRLSTLVSRMRVRVGEESQALLWSMPDEELTELLGELHALTSQIAAVTLNATREADRRDLGKTAGTPSTANWLSGLLRLRPEHAHRMVKLAHDLDSHLVLTQLNLHTGDISDDHAHVIARTIRDLPTEAGPDTRSEAEQVLLAHARTFNPKILAELGKTILEAVDPDLAERLLAKQLADEERKAARQRELSLHDDPYTTSTLIRGKLDPVAADMLRTALEPLAAPRPTTADGPDTRSYPQRLGDGLVELLRRYLNSGESPTHAGEKPHLVITIDGDDLAAGTGYATLLRTGTTVSARTAQQAACDAKISLWGTINGEPAITDSIRLFIGKTRRLLELRDRGCAFPGCTRPPSWCEAHHTIAWLQGGPTTVDNGVLLCGYHHRLIHQGTWTVHMAADGQPEFTPPEWISKTRKPLRNTRLRT